MVTTPGGGAASQPPLNSSEGGAQAGTAAAAAAAPAVPAPAGGAGPADQAPAAAAAAAMGAPGDSAAQELQPTAPPALPAGWVAAWDANYSRWYYCNAAKGVSQWELPPGDYSTAQRPGEALAAADQQQAAAPPADAAAEGAAGTAAGAAPGAAGDAAHSAGAPARRMGWCYTDAYGAVHGPFTIEQLGAWRSSLPMDLMVWHHDGAAGGAPAGPSPAGGADAQAAAAAAVPPQHQHQQQQADGHLAAAAGPADAGTASTAAAAPAATGSSRPWHEQPLPAVALAELLGDAHLLADWRRRVAATGGLDPSKHPPDLPHAPPAPAWHAWLQRAGVPLAAAAENAAAAGAWAATHAPRAAAGWPGFPSAVGNGGQRGGGGSGDGEARPGGGSRASEYAAAVLAGLPPNDEAVHMARIAAANDMDITELMAFQWRSSAGSTAVVGPVATAAGGGQGGEGGAEQRTQYFHNPHSGRLELRAAPQGADSLYGEPLASWLQAACSPPPPRPAPSPPSSPLPPPLPPILPPQSALWLAWAQHACGAVLHCQHPTASSSRPAAQQP